MSTTVVITGAAFKSGQDRASVDARTWPTGSTPDFDLIAGVEGTEFAAGYRYEWEGFSKLARNFLR